MRLNHNYNYNKEIKKMTDSKVDRRKSDLKHSKNPFLAETVAEVEIGYKTTTFGTGKTLADVETGEIAATAAYKQVRVVDRSQFLMFYLQAQNQFWQLSQREQKCFRLIFWEVQTNAIGKDEVYLSWETADAFFKEEGIKMSRATYFRAISELIEKKIIAESVRTNIFFINPLVIFNGNRGLFVQEIISKDPAIVDEAQEITAKRALEAHRKLSNGQMKEITDKIKREIANKAKSQD